MKKKSNNPTPHDATFRQFLTQPDTARDFMNIHLPAELLAICDLSTLKLESGSFVEDDLRQYFSDVLYSLKTTAGDGYVHVLIEHQSSPDKHMAFRLIRYAVAAMQRHLDAGHKKLPLVIPVLFYAGKRSPYPYSTRWLDEFDEPQLARQLYTEAFPLVDITIVPDDEIMQHRRIALLELIQKHIRDRDLIGMVDRITTLLVRGFTNDSQLQTLFNYLLQCGDTSRFTRFIEEIAERSPLQKERLMTIAERLRQEGHQIGWQEGKLEGLHEQAIKIALRMLEQGFDRDQVLAATQLSEADLAANNH